MSFPFYIARRYLFSKKSHHAINIISAISVAGVAIATMALVCTLSVFNGFQDMVATFFTAFDPQLKITPATGKTADINDPKLKVLGNIEAIDTLSYCLEGNGLAIYEGRQQMVTVKGVDEAFPAVTNLRNVLYGSGDLLFEAADLQYGIPGIGVARSLGMNTSYGAPLQVYAPAKGERVDLMNPESSFNQGELTSPGLVFVVKQSKYDGKYLLTSLHFAQELFDQANRFTSLELRLKPKASLQKVHDILDKELGTDYIVSDRYEQQSDIFRIMEIEKLMAYIFLTFILAIASFNIIGSLSMLIIDKKNDVNTLRSLGANDHQITHIFVLEGCLIALFGALIGIVLGVTLCWLQQTFGFITLGSSSGSFVIDAYPVSLRTTDLVIIFITVLLTSYLAVWFPIRHLTKK